MSRILGECRQCSIRVTAGVREEARYGGMRGEAEKRILHKRHLEDMLEALTLHERGISKSKCLSQRLSMYRIPQKHSPFVSSMLELKCPPMSLSKHKGQRSSARQTVVLENSSSRSTKTSLCP